jgi:hypothetical protein
MKNLRHDNRCRGRDSIRPLSEYQSRALTLHRSLRSKSVIDYPKNESIGRQWRKNLTDRLVQIIPRNYSVLAHSQRNVAKVLRLGSPFLSLSVPPSVWNKSRTDERISIKFDIWQLIKIGQK